MNREQTGRTLRELCSSAEQQLPNSPSARIDIETLLLFILKRDRSFLYIEPHYNLSDSEWTHYINCLQRRQSGEPVAYIVGERAFWSLDLKVTPDVLIPRPETEQLVERVLHIVEEGCGGDRQRPLRIIDVGTGSGAIALSLAKELPEADIVAVDISQPALRIAQDNAQRLGLTQVTFKRSDILADIEGKFDLIISNPPYIGKEESHLQQGDLRFEPEGALVAERQGLSVIERLAIEARAQLVEGGWLLVEHGYQQGEQVGDIFTQAGFSNVQLLRDLAGHGRITEGVIF